MTKVEFDNLDFYSKISFILSECEKINTKFEKFIDIPFVTDTIKELIDELVDNFNIFIQYEELIIKEIRKYYENRSKNDKNNTEEYEVLSNNDVSVIEKNMKEVLIISPLIKLGLVRCDFLVEILSEIIMCLEKLLPNNERLAHFFRKLLDHKTEFTEVMDVSEEEIEKVIGNMLYNVDEVDVIINVSKEKEKVNVKK